MKIHSLIIHMNKRLFKFFCYMTCLFTCLNFSLVSTENVHQEGRDNRGIVVAVNDMYAYHYFLASLGHLRMDLKCMLPIEIWHSGDELSEGMKQRLSAFGGVTFYDLAERLQINPHQYRGFQIKAKILELTHFDDVILMDADVYFFENPEILFDTEGYKQTGAYFFSDLPHSFPRVPDHSVFTVENYTNRRSFIQILVPQPSNFILQDMKEMWTNEIPTLEKPFLGDMQESGVVAIKKSIHKKGLSRLISLNENRNVTYKFVHGDKETFWLGFELAGESYTFNNQRPLFLITGNDITYIMQFLDERLFFQQKNPIPVTDESIFADYERRPIRGLTDVEKDKIKALTKAKELYK